MKKGILLLTTSIYSLIFSFGIALAQGGGPSSNWWPIVPCGVKSSGGNSTMCTLCDLFVGIQNILDFGFYVVIGAAIFVITVAGIMYIVSVGNTKIMEQAKTAIKNTVAGFIVLLLGWLIIHTVIFYLGARSGIQGGWGKFNCESQGNIR